MTAAETQFRLSVQEDAAWRWDGAPRTHSYLSNLCDAHTLDSLMERATQGDRIFLELHQVPGAGAWLVGGANSPLFDWDAELTRTAMQHRLRILCFQDTQCPLCGPSPRSCRSLPCAGDRNRSPRNRPGSKPLPSERESQSAPTPSGVGRSPMRASHVRIPHGKGMTPETLDSACDFATKPRPYVILNAKPR